MKKPWRKQIVRCQNRTYLNERLDKKLQRRIAIVGRVRGEDGGWAGDEG
jgi:hypothetical protein